MRILMAIVNALVLGSCQSRSSRGYLDHVEDYANALLDGARDRYGTEHSPLVASTLIRETMSLPEGDSLASLLSLRRENWGIRPHDRMLTGDKTYLERTGYFAQMALDMFFDGSSPLPKAITRADNLMMELLRYHLVINGLEIQSPLIYLDR